MSESLPRRYHNCAWTTRVQPAIAGHVFTFFGSTIKSETKHASAMFTMDCRNCLKCAWGASTSCSHFSLVRSHLGVGTEGVWLMLTSLDLLRGRGCITGLSQAHQNGIATYKHGKTVGGHIPVQRKSDPLNSQSKILSVRQYSVCSLTSGGFGLLAREWMGWDGT